MNTANGDTLRVNIFKELVNLDSEKLNQVYKYIKSLTSKEESDVSVLQNLLDASADYALKAHKRGEIHSTQEVMDKLGKDMGWM
mgnify:CR=1 FL=1